MYDRRTGQTHVLDAFPAHVAALVASGSGTSLTDLVEAVMASLGESGDHWKGRTEQVLRQLADLGILETRP
ncbi:MAG: HPr-rel-A system PqqD family peptide chaperone [Pseudohaliea sp.]